jgi:hypothetical protein
VTTTTTPKSYDHLTSWATARQLDYIEGIRKHGGMRQACRAEGWTRSAVVDSMKRLEAKAATQVPALHDYRNPLPEGFKLKGVSQFIDKDGKLAGQWVKSAADAGAQAAAQRAAFEALSQELPRLPALPVPARTYGNLANVYTFTDSHVGALAWHRETGGGDWDLTIAEKTLTDCCMQMVASAPQAATAVLAQLGDYLHYDSALAPVTPTHGHILDADGRMPKMVEVGVRILRRMVDMLLQHHERVVVLLGEGNHDITSSVWLRCMFRALYELEPRVTIIDSELPYYVFQHGATMLCWHHGHLAKKEALPLLFAARFPQMWGATSKRYVHVGHMHHVQTREHPGIKVEQHPTLAAPDAHSARGGYLSERQVSVITYSDAYGEVARNTVTPEMLTAA